MPLWDTVGACHVTCAVVVALVVSLLTVTALPLNVLMALPSEHAHLLTKGLKRTLADLERGGLVNGSFVLVPNKAMDIMRLLCASLQENKASLMLSFLPRNRAFFASMVTGATAVPIVSLTRNYTDTAAKEMNERHLSLDPVSEDLADALFLFLASQDWYEVTLLQDDSTMAATLGRRLKTLSNGQGLLRVIQLPTVPDKLLSTLSSAHTQRQRILLLCCSSSNTTLVVFREAKKLGMLTGEWIWILLESSTHNLDSKEFPVGILGLRLRRQITSRNTIRAVVEVVAESLRYLENNKWLPNAADSFDLNCWENATESRKRLSDAVFTVVKRQVERESPVSREGLEPPVFDILNLISGSGSKRRWKRLGNITGARVSMDSVVWMRPSNRHQLWGLDASFQERRPALFRGLQKYRVATAYSPPFVKPGTRVANGSCLIGVTCLQIQTNDPHLIATIFADYTAGKSEGVLYNVSCCAGVSIDLLLALSTDLSFDFELYLVADGFFGSLRKGRWNGITADLVSGAAHLTFSAFSMTSARQRVIDFSVPYFHSGVSCLTSSQYKEVPLSAFLIPFSIQLWVAIFAGLTATAIAAAIYEWFSPFGLNPWGRQRTRNFSLASALWVMWSLLFSHLVAFKAPKSWPNKVLINVWGCFSVIFLASYTANIAALFAGLFLHLRVDDFHDASLLNLKTGTAIGSAAEGYVFAENAELWQHIQKFGVQTLEEGLEQLRKKRLDVLIGDTAVLNYFRGNDPGCSLHLLGDSIFDDAYAVGVHKGFPLTNAISQLILKYNEYGFLDQLQKKWYGRVPCFDDRLHRFNQPEPLSVHAVAGVFIMLLVGMLVGTIILIMEHLVFKYALPVLRKMPKDCVWRSPNLMFFSQKLYRFINTVELVSPHHSAKEIVSNLREGQIASLFQKSVKKKFKEEARRRRSKSQFFEVIQEIRKVVRQQNEPRPPTWEDSSQQLTADSNTRDISGTFGEIENETQDEDEDEDHSRWRSTAVRFAPGTFRGHYSSSSSEAEESDDDSDETFGQSHITATEVNMSASTGDLLDTTLYEDDNACHYSRWSRSMDDIHSLKWSSSRGSTKRRRFVCDSKNVPWQCADSIDDIKLASMSKDELIRLWQGSERALLNRLRDTLREKKVLEEKLSFLQKTLLKPP